MRSVLASYLALLIVLAGLAVGGGFYVVRQTGPSDAVEAAAEANSFNIVSWELRHLPGKWLYKLGHLFDGRDQAQEEESLRRYFTLTQEIQQLERDPVANALRLEEAEDERAALENEVEAILEGRITSLLEEQGLVINPPLFSDLNLVFPPVDFEFDRPPRVLAISPRDRIEIDRTFLLTPGLDLNTIIDIEIDSEAAEGDEASGISAVVLPTSGVATYPSVVNELTSYHSLISTVIHEWIHQYLAFFPLGRSYFASNELRTLNETVASLADQELARLFVERYGSPELPPSPSATTPDSDFNFFSEMQALRQQVEVLLAEGRIDEAETLMEGKRQEFEEQGVFVRRINQAFFAFRGFYATSSASIDPIGPKMRELLERAGSPGEFVRRAAGLTSEADLDRLLAEG